MKTKKLKILENSLIKKDTQFQDKLQNHIDTVKQANGQPLNDKRNGQATLNKWERQNTSLKNLEDSIDKTKRAIEIEKGKIIDTEAVKNVLPEQIIKMIEEGILIQWRKYPNRFFVKDVDKARIVWDLKKKILYHSYTNLITDKEQWKIFAKIYNNLKKAIDKN